MKRYLPRRADPDGTDTIVDRWLARASHTATVAARQSIGGLWKGGRTKSAAVRDRAGSHVQYHPEVDGLRALAILPVVLFHIDVAGFGGGYIGVDVFFVISGYLITSLIQSELDEGRFSFLRFWERRARRILPALTVVMLFSLVAGWFILIPSDLENLGRSATAQALFSSNILFWLQSGYFDADAETKPLLHTWSLAVEEQFYLLFPLFLFVLSMGRRALRVWMVMACLLASLAISVWGIAVHPTATFYLLPTRAWELLLGSLIALTATGPSLETVAGGWRDEVLSWLGMFAIAVAVFGYDKGTPFPGLAALLPCLGTAAIIWTNGTRLTSLGALLSSPLLVQIGLISYSLYLWHWPLIVFAEYASFHGLSPFDKVLIIAASVILAWLSWKFVENPIRRRVVLTNRSRLAGVAATCLALVAILGLSADFAKGYPSRLPPQARHYADGTTDVNPRRDECHAIDWKSAMAIEPCRLGKSVGSGRPALLVWGDSHANALMPALDLMAADYSISGLFASYSGCPPIGDVLSPGKQNVGCPRFNKSMLDLAVKRGIRHVVLIANWSLYTEGQEDGNMAWLIAEANTGSASAEGARLTFQRHFNETINTLLQKGMTVWIIKQVPLQASSPPVRLTQLALYGGDPTTFGRPRSEHIARQSFVNSVIDGIGDNRVHRLDPAQLLCKDGMCKASSKGYSLYSDEHHLSRFGSLQMRPMLAGMFSSIAAETK